MYSKLINVVVLITILITLGFLKRIFPGEQDVVNVLYFQNFDEFSADSQWFNSGLEIQQKQDGNNSDLLLRQKYEPSSTGTPFIGKRFRLREKVKEATLIFDMKFDPEFEFVKGGKLHGLGEGALPRAAEVSTQTVGHFA